MFRRAARPPVTPPPESPPDPRSVLFFQRGMVLLAVEDTTAALQWFAAAADTDDPMLLFTIGGTVARLGATTLAVACYQRSAEAGNVDAMNNLGVLLKQNDRWAEAEHWLRAAAATGDRDALNNLGNVLNATGRPVEAQDCYSRSAKAGHVEALLSLGTLQLHQGDVKKAKRAFREAARKGHPAGELMLEVAERTPAQAPSQLEDHQEAPPVTIDVGDLPGSADALRLRAQETGDPEMLDTAIDVARLAMTAAGPDSDGQALAAATLCVSLRVRARSTGRKEDLLAALEAGRAGVAAADAGGGHGLRCRAALASALLDAHQQGEPGLDEALDLNRTIVVELDLDDKEYPAALTNLVNALLLTFTVGHDPEVLDEAVLHGREALALRPHRSVRRAHAAIPLSQALFQQAILHSSAPRFAEARQLAHEALADLPVADPNRAAIDQFVSTLDRVAGQLHP